MPETEFDLPSPEIVRFGPCLPPLTTLTAFFSQISTPKNEAKEKKENKTSGPPPLPSPLPPPPLWRRPFDQKCSFSGFTIKKGKTHVKKRRKILQKKKTFFFTKNQKKKDNKKNDRKKKKDSFF